MVLVFIRRKMADRETLINQLAASMGAGGFVQTKYEGSRYDKATGTLYCKGLAISKSTAEKAISHFELLADKCNMGDANSRELALMYMCAAESIKMMQRQRVKEALKNDPEIA